MRRRALRLAGFVLAGLLLAPAMAAAQVPRGDAASGMGSDGFFTFDFDARAGPSGENPSGEATVGCCGGSSPISAVGPVTCLAVSDNRAIIGMRNVSGTAAIPFVTIVAVDGGAGGVGDRFTATPQTVPSNCVHGFVGTPLIFGDIMVVDAPPLPVSKDQCKNGGWRNYGVFRNQGDCVSFVSTGGKDPPSGP